MEIRAADLHYEDKDDQASRNFPSTTLNKTPEFQRIKQIEALENHLFALEIKEAKLMTDIQSKAPEEYTDHETKVVEIYLQIKATLEALKAK